MTQEARELVRKLQEEAERLSGHSLDRGSVDAGIASNVADEAATTITTLLDKLAEAELDKNVCVARIEILTKSGLAEVALSNPTVMRQWGELTARAEAAEREGDEARALAERLKLEAQFHAGEARGANSTIYEIYQVLSGGKGEVGNWNGAEPARQYVAAAEARADKLAAALDLCADALAAAEQRDHDLRFRANTPRQDADVKHMRALALSRARSALAEKGVANG